MQEKCEEECVEVLEMSTKIVFPEHIPNLCILENMLCLKGGYSRGIV